jgi:hypothetical protein
MIIAIALISEPLREHHGADQPEHHQGKVFGGSELERELGQGHRDAAISMVATVPAKKEPSAAIAQRRAGLALARHLVAVEAGDHRGRFARHVEQDRRRRPAVLRAVVDAGQHDQRRHRLQRVGRRQQHRDRRDRADAGQHADQRAQQHADQCVQQVDRRQGDAEAEREVIEQLHGRLENCGQIGSCKCRPTMNTPTESAARTTPAISDSLAGTRGSRRSPRQ